MKKDKHGQYCHEKIFFSQFLLSVDGFLGKKAQVVLATLTRLMAEKMEEPVFNVKDWVNGRIAIVVASLYSQILHGAQVSSPLRTWDPDWDSCLGLGLAQ